MSGIGSTARAYRTAMWIVLVAGVLALGVAIAGLRGIVPARSGAVALFGFSLCLGLAAWFGLRSHRHTVAERELEESRTMLVLLAAQLGKQSNEALSRVSLSGGTAGEAAGMILEGRRGRGTELKDES